MRGIHFGDGRPTNAVFVRRSCLCAFARRAYDLRACVLICVVANDNACSFSRTRAPTTTPPHHTTNNIQHKPPKKPDQSRGPKRETRHHHTTLLNTHSRNSRARRDTTHSTTTYTWRSILHPTTRTPHHTTQKCCVIFHSIPIIVRVCRVRAAHTPRIGQKECDVCSECFCVRPPM